MTDDGMKGVKSVQMTFNVLEAIATSAEEVGVSELALSIGTTKATVFRHLQTLVDRGYVTQNPATSRYGLGSRSQILSQVASGRVDLLSASRQVAAAVRDELGQSVVVSAFTASGVTVLSAILGTSSLEIRVRPGTELELHSTAQGKIALAFGEHRLPMAKAGVPLRKFTEYTISSHAMLMQEVELVRELGYASAPEQSTLGINALAAPVLAASGRAVGTIAIVGSIQFIPREPKPEQIASLLRAATQISRNLGYVGSIPPMECTPSDRTGGGLRLGTLGQGSELAG